MHGSPRPSVYARRRTTDVAEALSASRGLADRFVLFVWPIGPWPVPRRELAGFEAVLGEFMPVRAEEADVMSSAGICLRQAGPRLNHGCRGAGRTGHPHGQLSWLLRRRTRWPNTPWRSCSTMCQVTTSNCDVLAGTGPALWLRDATCYEPDLWARVLWRHRTPWRPSCRCCMHAGVGTHQDGFRACRGRLREGRYARRAARKYDVVSLHCPLIPMTKGLIGAPA